MLNDGDRENMRRDLQAIIDDRPASITIRRGDSTLGAQKVRVARLSKYMTARNYNAQEAGSREMRGGILVCGSPTLDIQVDDRFNIDIGVYRVRFIRPNRDAGTQAEAELVE